MSVTDNVLQPHRTSVNPQLHRGEFQSEPTLQFSSSKLMVFFGRGRSPTRLGSAAPWGAHGWEDQIILWILYNFHSTVNEAEHCLIIQAPFRSLVGLCAYPSSANTPITVQNWACGFNWQQIWSCLSVHLMPENVPTQFLKTIVFTNHFQTLNVWNGINANLPFLAEDTGLFHLPLSELFMY